MRFLLDESFPAAAQGFLAEQGHTVLDSRREAGVGADDASVFRCAQQHEAVLLTTDRDFYHSVPWQYGDHFGVVVIALRQPNRAAILRRLAWLLKQSSLFPLRDKVVQLRDKACRVRQARDSS